MRVSPLLLLSSLTYVPPIHPPNLSPSLPPYQDVWEADVIAVTRCRTLRNGSEQAATVPFPCGIVAA